MGRGRSKGCFVTFGFGGVGLGRGGVLLCDELHECGTVVCWLRYGNGL